MQRLLIILLFAAAQASFAQQVFISQGEKLNSEMIGYDILGKGPAGELFIYKKYRFDDEITVYDAEMNVRRTRNITLKNIQYETHEVIKNGDRIFQFYTEKAGKAAYLKFQEYNLQLEAKNDPVLIDSTVTRLGEAYSTYRVVRSEPEGAVLTYKFSYNNGRIEQTFLQVLNHEGRILLNTQFYVPATDFSAEPEQISVSPDGRPVFLFRNDQFSCRKDLDNLSYWFAFPTQGGSVSSTPISGSQYGCLKELGFAYDRQHHLVIATGFVGEENRYSMDSYLMLQIDPAGGALVHETQQPFSDALRSSITSLLDKNSRFIPAYQVSEVIPRADGGVLLVGEYYDKTIENYDFTNYDPYYGYRTSTRQVEFYEYSDILLLSIDPQGTLSWSNIIRKKQVSKDDKGVSSSFGIINSQREMFFLFNEDITQNSNVIMYNLGADGTLDRKSLFNPAKQEVELRPSAARQVSYNELIIPSIYKRTLAFVKIKI